MLRKEDHCNVGVFRTQSCLRCSYYKLAMGVGIGMSEFRVKQRASPTAVENKVGSYPTAYSTVIKCGQQGLSTNWCSSDNPQAKLHPRALFAGSVSLPNILTPH